MENISHLDSRFGYHHHILHSTVVSLEAATYHAKSEKFHVLILLVYQNFISFFGDLTPKCPLFICFDILQHNGCQKGPKGPPFTFFGTVTLFKKFILKFFWELF